MERVPRVQFFSKIYELASCVDWYLKEGARKSGTYKTGEIQVTCDFDFTSCEDVVEKGLLPIPKTKASDFHTSIGEGDFQIQLSDEESSIGMEFLFFIFLPLYSRENISKC